MYKKLTAWLFLLVAAVPGIQAEQEFLKPDQAFVISAQAVNGDTLIVNWDIAEGYYLYQSKFRFLSDTGGIEFGEPDLPPALTENDPVFGDVEIYRNNVSIQVPITAVPGNADMFKLQARSQGCAEDGICYPPHTQTLLVALDQSVDAPPPVDPSAVVAMDAAGSATSEQAPAANIEPIDDDPLRELAALGESLGLGFEEDDLLTPEQAFQVIASSGDGSRLQVQWTIADGTYLYQDKVKLELKGEGVQLGAFSLPPPDIKEDSIKPDGTFGDVPVYHNLIDLDIPLVRDNTDATTVELTAHFQGCADRGICYPPQKEIFTLELPAASGAATVAAIQSADVSIAAEPESIAPPQAEHDQIASLLSDGNFLLIVASFFGIGLLLAFTPCVFPMIPILSGIIAGHGKDITTRKAFMLSLIYVLAMALTYTVAGMIVGFFSVNLATTLQQPVWLIAFALIFIALAFSMFGFYELQLPSRLQSKLTEISNRQKGGNYTGVAIMGLLSALIVGPCLAPPLAGALIFISQTGDAVLGGTALFAMGIGMGIPLLLIGASAGKLLPRAGAWMDAVKAVFGVLMLAVALTMLERLVPTYIPDMVIMLAWGLLLIGSGIYMGALEPLQKDASGWSRLWKGLGLAVVIYGATFMIGAAFGSKDTIQPLRGVFVGSGAAHAEKATFIPIKTEADLARELAAAKAQQKTVMLDFYADWCTYCKQMERQTFPDPQVQAALTQMVLLKADVTRNDDADKALQRHVGVTAPPAMIFWDTDGKEIKHLRLLGFKGPGEFAQHLNEALNL